MSPEKFSTSRGDGRPKLGNVEAAEYLDLSPSTLSKLRVRGDGPAYLKLGRRVVYDLADLESWSASKRRNSTSEVA